MIGMEGGEQGTGYKTDGNAEQVGSCGSTRMQRGGADGSCAILLHNTVSRRVLR